MLIAIFEPTSHMWPYSDARDLLLSFRKGRSFSWSSSLALYCSGVGSSFGCGNPMACKNSEVFSSTKTSLDGISGSCSNSSSRSSSAGSRSAARKPAISTRVDSNSRLEARLVTA